MAFVAPTLPLSFAHPHTDWTTSNGTAQQSADMLHILLKHNEKKATLYIPVIVYMVILILVGVFGNILVCFVYCMKQTKTSSHYFILTLAIFDLLTCIIGMPTEIVDLTFPYMFYASAACKLLRFIESVTSIGSSMILISVAVDRYLRICKLGRSISVKVAQRICISAMIVGAALSWPTFFIFGRATTKFENDVIGVGCSTDDSMTKRIYPTLYYGFLGLLFLCCLTFFSIIYTQIGLQIWRQKRTKIGRKKRVSEFSSKKGMVFSNSSIRESDSTVEANDVPVQITQENGYGPISTDMSSDPIDDSYHPKKKTTKNRRTSSVSSTNMKSDPSKRRAIKVTRTTVVLFAVTVAYVLSYLPFLILMMIRSIIKNFESNINDTQEVIYKFCVKSYFINNAINPMIYSFFNAKFRKDAKHCLVCIVDFCCKQRTIKLLGQLN